MANDNAIGNGQYTRILSTKQWQEGDRLLGLLPHHVTVLRARGISDETAIAANLHTEADKIKLASILDRKYCPFKSAAIVIPYSNLDGQNGYARVRPDNPRKNKDKKPIKYESPVGRRGYSLLPARRGGTGARHRAGPHRLRRRIQGPTSTQHGFPCIGLVGVFGWAEKNKGEALLPEMEHIPWQGRQVYIAYDSDITDKPDVQDAESRLAAHLTNRGAIVKVVRIPAGPPDAKGQPTKLGLDDYLVRQDDPEKGNAGIAR